MSCPSSTILHDLSPFLIVYTDGRVERLIGTDVVPATLVQSKDVVIAPETGVSARLYLPKNASPDHKPQLHQDHKPPLHPDHKLPLLVYFHGGAFMVESAFSPTYHNHLNIIAAEANVVVVSVDYRLAPEHPVPIAYDDCWDAVKWAASHSRHCGREPWLKDHVDFKRVFFAGDSAGANIAHNMAIRVGSEKLDPPFNLVGIILNDPYFWGINPVGSETVDIDKRDFVENLWRVACPSSSGTDDPHMNPAMDPKLSSLGCSKVLVSVAGDDLLRDRGWYYHEVLGKSGWGGQLEEVLEAEGEGHVFFLQNPTGENALTLFKRMASFINDLYEATQA